VRVIVKDVEHVRQPWLLERKCLGSDTVHETA
jgi:hypothetical protein